MVSKSLAAKPVNMRFVGDEIMCGLVRTMMFNKLDGMPNKHTPVDSQPCMGRYEFENCHR